MQTQCRQCNESPRVFRTLGLGRFTVILVLVLLLGRLYHGCPEETMSWCFLLSFASGASNRPKRRRRAGILLSTGSQLETSKFLLPPSAICFACSLVQNSKLALIDSGTQAQAHTAVLAPLGPPPCKT